VRIEKVREVYKIKSDRGHEYYSRRKPQRKDEKVIETIPFTEYLIRNGVSVEMINRARDGRNDDHDLKARTASA